MGTWALPVRFSLACALAVQRYVANLSWVCVTKDLLVNKGVKGCLPSIKVAGS